MRDDACQTYLPLLKTVLSIVNHKFSTSRSLELSKINCTILQFEFVELAKQSCNSFLVN